jgi:hypothetical protein
MYLPNEKTLKVFGSRKKNAHGNKTFSSIPFREPFPANAANSVSLNLLRARPVGSYLLFVKNLTNFLAVAKRKF